MTRKKPLLIIGAIILIIALVAAWTTWRKNETAQTQQQTQTTATTRKQKKKKETTLTDEEKTTYANLATQFETAARTWGTDPDIKPSDLAKLPAAEALAKLKAPDLGSNPLTELSSITIPDGYGPDGEAEGCLQGYENSCNAHPTMRQWWESEAYAYGSKWTDGPTVSVADDGTVTVTGTVRAILLQDGDTFDTGEYYALTPAWKNYTVKDTLTVKDGKIVSMRCSGANHWWINPWLMQWNTDMADDMASNSERTAIPVAGKPDMGLQHYGFTPILKGPDTMGDLDGDVSWDLWDGLVRFGGA